MGDRRLDIGETDIFTSRGVEVKSGYADYNQFNQLEVQKDMILVSEGWDIRWHFDGYVTAPLLEALDAAGIPWTVKDPSNISKRYTP